MSERVMMPFLNYSDVLMVLTISQLFIQKNLDQPRLITKFRDEFQKNLVISEELFFLVSLSAFNWYPIYLPRKIYEQKEPT